MRRSGYVEIRGSYEKKWLREEVPKRRGSSATRWL